MCGILLIYSKKGRLNKQNCNRSLGSLQKRGPDATLSSFFLNKQLFIGNTILKIVGNIKNKKKLYYSKSKRFVITFNGEIYNYKKISERYKKLSKPVNDTDLLVNIHDLKNEIKIAKILDGMFAYCVFDQKKEKIFFASDAQGEKKIFIYNDKDLLICSSNITSVKKTLKKNKIQIKKSGLKNYFDLRHFSFFNETIYNNISYIDPGVMYTYDIKSNIISKKIFDDPVDWISKKKYNYLNRNQSITLSYFDKLLGKVAKKLTPKISFSSVMSGGIDSTLQLKLLMINNKGTIKDSLFVDHGDKDPISRNILKFEKFIYSKINILKLDAKKYYLNLKETYKCLQLPFFSHDLVGRFLIYKFFKNKKYKVIFAADGADEVFGGYEAYRKINWEDKRIFNPSPYSSSTNIFSDKNQEIKIKSNALWLRAFKKYNTFLSLKESRMQATLFTDYFMQAIGVHNISTDLLAGENSIEVRNIFTTKEVIKNALNLPIKYKINLKNSHLFVLKPLLKLLFSKYLHKKLIYKKQGFSGFPNESIYYLKKKQKKQLFSFIKKFQYKYKLNKAIEWKLINCFYFKYFCKQKIDLNKLF